MSGAGGVGGVGGGGGHGHGAHRAHSGHGAGHGHGAHGAHGAHKGGGNHSGAHKGASVDHANRCVHGQHSPGSPGKTSFPNTKAANDFLSATSKGSIQSAHWQMSGSQQGGSVQVGMDANQPPTIIVIMANGQSFGYVFSSDQNWEYKGDQAQKTASANHAPRVGVQHNHEAGHGKHHGHSNKSAHGHHSGHHSSHGVAHSHSGHGHHGGHMKAGGKGGGHGGGGHGGGGGGGGK